MGQHKPYNLAYQAGCIPSIVARVAGQRIGQASCQSRQTQADAEMYIGADLWMTAPAGFRLARLESFDLNLAHEAADVGRGELAGVPG